MENMDIKPIETIYKGYRFRSRLEARWAVFFDALEIKWEYEKEGYQLPNGQKYLPDFWLPWPPKQWNGYSDCGTWLEVKGVQPTDTELESLRQLSMMTKHNGILAFGLPGEHFSYRTHNSGILRYEEDDLLGRLVDLMANLHRCVWNDCFGSRNAFLDAIQAARSARFEHGGQTWKS